MKAYVLNQHFASICPMTTADYDKDIAFDKLNLSTTTLDLFTVTTNEVEKCLKAIDVSKATSQGISSKILKEAGPVIVEDLKHICNYSLSSGVFPERWKIGLIHPLFKDGDTTLPTNYRPITLLPSMSKILERLVYNKLYEHLKKHDLLTPLQSGFIQGDSTTNQLVDLVHEIGENLAKGRFPARKPRFLRNPEINRTSSQMPLKSDV
ncbi:unnamed protein product [Didymodactylos carnosus]|uniref:Reverse transcriptase domain-containing protein n=1 Tax=Didymodactylos carnosus TaxID=1234261 RepID=A0A8S2D9X1_9BILA|nr:unnamed protein product [Didymodactylos carnosus]CAF3665659.1 unnamed protein product [Didymodactylos carnosus]